MPHDTGFPLSFVVDRTSDGVYRVELATEMVVESASIDALLHALKVQIERRISAETRPNPRPVRVDDEGRLFEMSGEPIHIPGLGPEAIREGLADLKAGRYRPLREIIAARTK